MDALSTLTDYALCPSCHAAIGEAAELVFSDEENHVEIYSCTNCGMEFRQDKDEEEEEGE